MMKRREVLKAIAALPAGWVTPVVEVGQLPLHAQVSLQTGVVPCGQPVSGDNSADTRIVELGKNSGTFTLTYETYSVPDRITVSYEGVVLHDTGCVGEEKSVPISYAGLSTQVTVQVIPNCENEPISTWVWVISCP